MITPIVETENRWLLEVGQAQELPCGAVEIAVSTHALTSRLHLGIVVSLDDPDVVVDFTVRPS